MFYSTAQAVKDRTGIQPADLGQPNDATLNAFLEGLLAEISDLMNRRMKRDYLAELAAGEITAIPPGLTGIASDIASDSVREMVATRQTPVVRIDDFAVRVIQSRIFSPDIKQRLKLYARTIGSIDTTPAHIEPDPSRDSGLIS